MGGGGESVFITPPRQVEAVTSRSFLNGFVLAWSWESASRAGAMRDCSSVPKGFVSKRESFGGVFLCRDGTSERAGGMMSVCLT